MSKELPGKKLVIVESPTKAKTIRKFLGRDYIVESCMGHVRDLPQTSKDIPEKFKKEKWAQLGVNVDDGFQPIYLVPKNKTKVVTQLKDKLAEADVLILATDEDREGESISWHLVSLLKPKVPVKRMVFHEITKEAIEEALTEFRDIDMNLVRAQEARRILDRLVGYTISPVLWKKVAYGLSAGRVQSVAVRLVAEREMERLKFKKAEYWDVSGQNEKEKVPFQTRLINYQGKKIATGKDFDAQTGQLLKDKAKDILALNEDAAKKILNSIQGQDFTVSEVEEKPVSRKPAPPFITSTLQQEANRKLGWTSREAMQVAQKLYENGLITYMRTDSTNLSEQAINAARKEIQSLYGKDYLPEQPRSYAGKKVKGAQEAHEAIRPAGTTFVHPDEMKGTTAEVKLYELIWKRTMASQMVNSEHKQLSARFTVGDATFAASGMTVEFPGFLKAYVEGSDDPDATLEEKDIKLPKLTKGEKIKVIKLTSESHETKPPARFTEASLVQTLEKMGIGRPSTYASIMGTIQDRGYVRKGGNALMPTFTAMVVTQLLSQYFAKYVDYEFTSGMENTLDEIASGEMEQLKYLGEVYSGDEGLKKHAEKQDKNIDPEMSREIALPGLSEFSFRVGRYGAYVCRKDPKTGADQCASIPDAQSPGDMTAEAANQIIDQKLNGADAIGKDPVTGLAVYALSGRYGPYVQLGESEGEDAKPKRMAIPAGMSPETIDLDRALWLLSMPRTLGQHPTLGKDIKMGIGRFGPYVVCDGDFRSIPKTENLFEMDFKKAFELMSQPKKGRGRAAPIKELGQHPQLKEEIQILSGKYGPYIKCGKVNASIPQDKKPEDITLAEALAFIEAKMSSSPAAPEKKTAAKKTASKVAPKAAVKASVKVAQAGSKSSGKAPTKPSGLAVKAPPAKASTTKTSVKTVTRTAGQTVAKPAGKAPSSVAVSSKKPALKGGSASAQPATKPMTRSK
ncbi:MAG: type I DNA topoisomerase [Bdellovibrionota bacterium]